MRAQRARRKPTSSRPSPARTKAHERGDRRAVDKFAERRRELATAALETLSTLGYANTSLREIAQNTEFSHGVLHYYFADKAELIMYCVRQYKEECVRRYDEIVATASTAAELKRGFARALGQTLREDAAMHRLWYDLRNQSLFETQFRTDVLAIDRSLEQMIWRVVSHYAELAGKPVALPASSAYAAFDGLFLQGLVRFVGGRSDAPAELVAQAERLLEVLVDRG